MCKELYVFLGASTSGKSTVGDYLEENYKNNISKCVTYTTREMRDGEVDGKSYYFISMNKFRDLKGKIESSLYSGNYYSLTEESINQAFNKADKAFVIMELNGVKEVLKYYKNSDYIKIHIIYFDISYEEMNKRLILRGEKKKVIQSRLRNAITNNELSNHNYADLIIDASESKENVRKKVINYIFNEKRAN